MSLEDLGNIGEFVAAVVVVVTLGYLAIQIRQNTHAVRVAAEASQQELGSDFRGRIIDNAEVASIYLRGLQDFDSLAEADQVRFRMLMFTAFMSHQYRFVHERHNLMDPELTERGDNILRYYVAHFADRERLFRSIVIGRFGDRERSGATPVSLFL